MQRQLREKLLDAARRREIDVVLVWRLDRWGRSVADLLATLQELEHLGVGFVSLTEALDLTTPAGRAMAALLAVFAEFEREVIVDRIKRGLAHARSNGKIGGGRYKLSPADQMEAIRLIQVEKMSQGQVAHIYRVDRSTISRMMTEVRLKQDLKGGVLE